MRNQQYSQAEEAARFQHLGNASFSGEKAQETSVFSIGLELLSGL